MTRRTRSARVALPKRRSQVEGLLVPARLAMTKSDPLNASKSCGMAAGGMLAIRIELNRCVDIAGE